MFPAVKGPSETSESAGGPLRSRLLRGGGVNESALCSASFSWALSLSMQLSEHQTTVTAISLREPTSLKDAAGAEAAVRLDGRQCLCFSVRILNCTSADFLCDCVPKITPAFKAKAEGRSDWSRLMHFRARSEERCRRSGSGTDISGLP